LALVNHLVWADTAPFKYVGDEMGKASKPNRVLWAVMPAIRVSNSCWTTVPLRLPMQFFAKKKARSAWSGLNPIL